MHLLVFLINFIYRAGVFSVPPTHSSAFLYLLRLNCYPCLSEMDVRVAAMFRIAVFGSKIKWRNWRAEVWYTHVHIIVLLVNENILYKGQFCMACRSVLNLTTVTNVSLLNTGLYGTVYFALLVPDFQGLHVLRSSG